MIKEENGKWVLYNKDGTRKLGTHESRAKALSQERAIQMSKRSSVIEKLSFDVKSRIEEKLKLVKVAMHPAMEGALGLTAAMMAPAALNAYANDKDVLKTMAGTAAYTLPIGALGGAAYGEAMPLINKAMETAGGLASAAKNVTKDMVAATPEVVNKVLDSIAPRVQGLKDKADSALTSMNTILTPVADAVNPTKEMIMEFLRRSGAIIKDEVIEGKVHPHFE